MSCISGLMNPFLRLGSRSRDRDVGDVPELSLEALTQNWEGKSVLVVGGTRGVGRGMALVLASCGANVFIAGRSGGDTVVKAMESRRRNPQQKFLSFVYDASTVKGCLALTQAVKAEGTSLDALVMTVASWPKKDVPVAGDGVDHVVALMVIARFVMVQELCPLMKPGSRVMNVLSSTLMMYPVSVKKMQEVLAGEKANMVHLMCATAISADAFLQQAAVHFPKLHFIGTHPGFVDTGLCSETFSGCFLGLKNCVYPCLPAYRTEEKIGIVEASILCSSQAAKRDVTYFNALLEARRAEPKAYDKEYSAWLWTYLEGFVKDHAK